MKKYLLGTLAIALAVGFSSFTTLNSKKFFDYYVIGQTTISEVEYWQVSSQEPDNCSPSVNTFPCSVVSNQSESSGLIPKSAVTTTNTYRPSF